MERPAREGGNHAKYGKRRKNAGRADVPYFCNRGVRKFSETIERTKRPRKSSRVRRLESKRSSHEPMSRSRVTLSSINMTTISSMAGNMPGLAAAAPVVMESSQQTEASDEKSAIPYASPMM